MKINHNNSTNTILSNSFNSYIIYAKDFESFYINGYLYPKAKRTIGAPFTNFIDIDYQNLNLIDQFSNYHDINIYIKLNMHEEQIPFKMLLNKGWTYYSGLNLFIDLKKEEKTLWKFLRSSYKSLINRSLKNNKHIILDYKNLNQHRFNDWIELYGNKLKGVKKCKFKKLFLMQYDFIRNKQALISLAYNKDNCILGGMYFLYEAKNSSYAFSANNDIQNCGHAIMWNAIKYLKAISIESLELNGLSYENQLFCPYERKNAAITFFKEGFGAIHKPVFYFSKLSTLEEKNKFITIQKSNLVG